MDLLFTSQKSHPRPHPRMASMSELTVGPRISGMFCMFFTKQCMISGASPFSRSWNRSRASSSASPTTTVSMPCIFMRSCFASSHAPLPPTTT